MATARLKDRATAATLPRCSASASTSSSSEGRIATSRSVSASSLQLATALSPLLALVAFLVLSRRAPRKEAPPAPLPPEGPPPGVAYVGRVVGDYLLDKVIGVGSSAAVYAARQLSTGLKVAVKVASPALARGRASLDRFFAEARVANAIPSRGVPRAFCAQRTPDGVAYIAMELVPGASLDRVLSREEASGGTSLEVALARTLGLLAIVEACDRVGVVPLDLSPRNVIIDLHGEVHLVDHGLVKTPEDPGPPDGSLVGSPGHIPPEQARGELSRVDAKSVIWAVGSIMYLMLTGQRPHEAVDDEQLLERTRTRAVRPISLLVDLPPGVARAIDRALAFEKRHRFATAGELAATLEAELTCLRASERRGGTRQYDHEAFATSPRWP